MCIRDRFDAALKQKTPHLPLWLVPIQVRVIPLSDKFLKEAEKIADKIEEKGVRVDVDDRPLTLPKRVREAEMEWINYVLVVGQKEIDSGILPVRDRGAGKIRRMRLPRLISEIKKQTDGKPFRSSTLPRRLSQRPQF